MDIIKDLQPNNILDCGSGPGLLSKYIYYENENININCIENNPVHYKQMLENFGEKSNILKPNIKVNANAIKGNIINMPFKDNEFDFVFTCTVLMHIPFCFSIASICEIVRVSNKYICHIENINDIINCVVIGDCKSQLQKLIIDYNKLYDKLGCDIIKHVETKDPYANCNYIWMFNVCNNILWNK